MKVVKVPTDENLADALMKGVESVTLRFHVHGVGSEIQRGRHDLAPKVEDEKSEELKAQRNLSHGEEVLHSLLDRRQEKCSMGRNVGMSSSVAMDAPTFRSLQSGEIDTRSHDTVFS